MAPRRFKAFYDDSPFGVFRANATGVATYANDACCGIAGLDAAGFLGFGWIDAVHSADRRRVLAEWRKACAARHALDTTYRLVRPDGSRRHVRLQARPFPAEDAGETEGYVGVLVDMTEQVIAERRLRRNNELLSAVLENIPCGVTVFDADGSLILDNQKFRSLLRLPEEAADDAITDFGTLAVDAGPRVAAYPDTADPWHPDTGFDPAPRVREELQPDGRVLEVRDAPMPTGGIVTTYTDITQHKQNIATLQQAKAEAEQAAAAKAAFLATMSHEIRTPMNGVIGMTNILMNSRLTPDQRDVVDVIRQSGESLLVVINDILDYSRIEAGQMEMEWLPLRLQEVVDNSLRLLGPRAQEKDVAIAVDLGADIPPLILGDRTRLQQVLMNLVSNAVKFTERGEVRISVTNASAASPRDSGAGAGDLCTLTVSVEDTGIGIPREKLDTIFEPFVQADSSTARRFGGTGLGLAIAKRLVEAMGGTSEIESEPRVGTRVRFSFLAETAVPSARGAAASDAPLWGKRVLLVSGSRSDVGPLVLQLKRWGMEVHACGNAADAPSMLARDEGFDLVLAAAHLVDTRGLEFVRSLRDAGVTVPAVLLSRTKQAKADHPGLRVWVLPRSASESALYDTLVDAALRAREAVLASDEPASDFDRTLAARAPLRILVAEDNEINRQVALRMLGGFGYRADVAQDGAQVIDAVRQRRYDLVLMDIQMPKVDGIEAIRYIVQNVPPPRRPRIVAMSANVMREDVEAALATGADEYIGKPFAASELRAALEQSAPPEAAATARSPAPPAAPPRVLSHERIQRHLQGDGSGEFVKGLATSFARASSELLTRLSAAVASDDAAGLRAAVHEYAGMCAVLGAEKLVHLTLELQKLARNGSLKQAAALVRRCEEAQDETVAALDALVQQHRKAAHGQGLVN